MVLTLRPDLSHCVETVARRKYERALGLVIKDNKDAGLEEELELLWSFLESADFSDLRNRCDRYLLDNKHVEVRLVSSVGSLAYQIEIDEVV